MSEKRIISFYYKHKAGGFTTRLYKAWLGLANNGYLITYISTEKLPVDHPNISPQIILCKSRAGTLLFWLEYFVRAIFTARRLNKKHPSCCFFVFSFFYSTLAILAGMGNDIKTLVFIRADDLHTSTLKSLSSLRMKVHLFLERFSIKHASLVVATNQNMMNLLRARNHNKDTIDYLPNNIVNADFTYPEKRYSSTDLIFRFVTASVLNEGKNILYTLKALNKMQSTNWEFLIIGDDVEKTGYGERIEHYIQTHNLQDKVKLLGWKDNADKVISRCDLFILSTIMEGSPNALLEALGTNISCVGSDIPEVSEILNHPELVFNLQDPKSLTKTLESFCTNEDFREKLAKSSQECRERYTFNWEERIVEFVNSVTPANVAYNK